MVPVRSVDIVKLELDGVRIVILGDLDAETVSLFDAAIDTAVASKPSLVVVDLSGVTFLSSAGLGALLHARSRVQSLWVTRENRLADRLIEITGRADLYGQTDEIAHTER